MERNKTKQRMKEKKKKKRGELRVGGVELPVRFLFTMLLYLYRVGVG